MLSKIKACSLFIFLFILILSSSLWAREWTILVYCAADNNLDWNGVNDLNELELAGSTSEVAIIYFMDRLGANNSHLYYVNKDPSGLAGGDDNNTVSAIIDTSAPWLAVEEDMGNPNTLKDFLLWGIQTFPAEHYLLSIWDHGSGIFKRTGEELFKGECWDETGGVYGEYIDLKELREVLDSAYVVNGNKKIDIVGHDVCVLGQIETFYQMAPYVKIGIASESNEPGDGWDYEHPFKDLVLNPYMPAETLAAKIVNYTVDSYPPDEFSNTQAAVDLDSLKSVFVPIFKNFAGSLYFYMYPYTSAITNAWTQAEYYNYPNLELHHFSQKISQDVSLPQDLRSSASSVLNAYAKTVIASKQGQYQPNAVGFTIWFPDNYATNAQRQDYLTKIDFSIENWDEFLAMFDNPHLAIRGDYDQDGVSDISDIVFLINYVFYQGLPPEPLFLGDVNCDNLINIEDVVYLINYVFYQGSSPCFKIN